MKRGRRPQGPRTAERLDASAEARRKLQLILSTISGQCTVGQACEQLGISERRFFQMRDEALGAAAARLEPGQAGRPPMIESPQDARVSQLEAEVRELRIELRAAQVREELSVVMPQVLRPVALKKKTEQSIFGSKRSGASTSSTSGGSGGPGKSRGTEAGGNAAKKRSGSGENLNGR